MLVPRFTKQSSTCLRLQGSVVQRLSLTYGSEKESQVGQLSGQVRGEVEP